MSNDKAQTQPDHQPAVGGPGCNDLLGHTARHPTIAECEEAGRGPYNCPGLPYQVGGLPDTSEERERFEAYMRGHCWDVGKYDETAHCYDSMFVRCCYGVWRDRGALPTVWPNALDQKRGGTSAQNPASAPVF